MLTGKVAVVSGGSRGLGAAITRKLVSWGCFVYVVFAHRPGPAAALQAELGDQISTQQCDVTDAPDLAQLVGVVAENRVGASVDFVIHCAAAAPYGPLLETTAKQWQFTMNTNAHSLLLLAQAFRALLATSKSARFISVTNSAPTKIIKGAGLLAAAKSATETLTSYLAYELAADQISVNCVRPGLMATDVLQVRPDYAQQLEQEKLITPWPDQPVTTPEAVADAIALLCLPESHWMSGETIAIDGGYRWWGHHQSPSSEPNSPHQP